MTRLLMLVEGDSERKFVTNTLAPFLAEQGVYVESPAKLWTKRNPAGGGYHGGVVSWQKIRKSLLPLMGDSNAWVTTLLDFYGLPEDFPGYLDILGDNRPPLEKVGALEERFAQEVNFRNFIPFFALHEFEAWLFSAPAVAAEHFGQPDLANKMRNVVTEMGGPELINHGVKTHPKNRLKTFVGRYEETSDGPILLEKIGIPAIQAACPHFAAWLDRLQALSANEP